MKIDPASDIPPEQETSGTLVSSALDRNLINWIQDQYESGNPAHYLTISMPVTAFDPLACLELLGDDSGFQYYWEKPDRELTLAGGNPIARITAEGTDRFQVVADRVKYLRDRISGYSSLEHTLSGAHLLGGFSFFDRMQDPEWHTFAPASFTLPGWLLVKDGKMGILTLAFDTGRHADAVSLIEELQGWLVRFEEIFRMDSEQVIRNDCEVTIGTETTTPAERKQWNSIVKQAREMIRNDQFEKIVLSRKYTLSYSGNLSPTLLLHILRNQYPSCFCFLIRQQSGPAFIGCSPERLASFQGSRLLTEGLAGSISRGTSAGEDAYFENMLLNSRKNRNEHRFVVDAIVKRLEPFISKIRQSHSPTVRKLSNVQHLLTPITAWLNDKTDPLEILEQLHPTPAVGGFPREQALPKIYDLEQYDRGWYAGPVGWLDLNGNGEFTVAIRSGLVSDRQVHFYAGCGIVADSDPDTEWDETNLKFSPMVSAIKHAGSER